MNRASASSNPCDPLALRSNADEFKSIAIFCGPGLLLSLVAALSYGLDPAAFF